MYSSSHFRTKKSHQECSFLREKLINHQATSDKATPTDNNPPCHVSDISLANPVNAEVEGSPGALLAAPVDESQQVTTVPKAPSRREGLSLPFEQQTGTYRLCTATKRNRETDGDVIDIWNQSDKATKKLKLIPKKKNKVRDREVDLAG
jgi:hypothetical protein